MHSIAKLTLFVALILAYRSILLREPILYLTIITSFLLNITNAIITSSKQIGAGSAAIGLTGAGVGIGSVFSGLITGASRNIALKDQLFQYAILGFALSEATGLFALMVSMLILYT